MFMISSMEMEAQCLLLDGNNVPTANPVWVGCSQVTSSNDTTFTINVFPGGTFGAYTINWGDGNTSNGPGLAPPGFVSHTYTAVTGGGTIFADTFFLQFTSGGCTINGIVVSGYPVTANIGVPGGLTSLTCAPGDLLFTNNSNGVSSLPVMPSTIFTWDFGDGSPVQTFNYLNEGDTVAHTYQRNTVNCVTEVILTANNECNLAVSENRQSPVLIYDLDDAAINASATVLCYPDTIVDFLNGSMMNCLPQGNTQQRYALWNFGDYWGLGYDSIIGWRRSVTPVQDPPAPLTIGFPGIGTYVVNMIDSNMCGQEPTSIVIQIVAPPTADFSLSDDTICEGEQVTFTNLTTGGANLFRWDFGEGGGFVAVGGGNQTRTYNTAGTYTITLAVGIAGSNCNDTVSKVLVVKPTPTANINLTSQVGCDSLNVIFTDNSTGTPMPNDWRWNFGNGNIDSVQNPAISQFYPTPNTYNVSLTVTNSEGCSNTDTEVITVYESPVPAFTSVSVCANQIATFTDNSTNAMGDPILQWNWNFGDASPGSTDQNPTHIYTTSGPFDVILAVSTANCTAIDTFPIVVEDLPTAAFTMNNVNGCSPLSVDFTNTSSANAVNAYWDFGDGDTSTATDPNHVFTNTTANNVTYTVTLIASTSFGCTDTITQTVEVFPIPTALFTSNATLNCAPLIVDFTNLSSANSVSYQWDFGDGDMSTATNPTDTFENKTQFIQMFNIQLVATSVNGCTDTFITPITVYPEPQFSFGTNPDSGCSPLEVTFPSVIGAVVYTWDFGDGTFGAGPTPMHTYTNNGTRDTTFTIELIARSPFGCVDTNYGDVKVFSNPTAQFAVNKNLGCPDLDVQFTNGSLDATDYTWDFGDNTRFDTTDLVISHTFSNTTAGPIIYDAKLIAKTAKGCLDSISRPITVYAPVTSDFSSDTAGCSVFDAKFTNQSSPAATVFRWDFGDGGTSILENPSRGFINIGTEPITRTVTFIASSTDGCSDTIMKDVTVFPAPEARVSVDGFVLGPFEKTFPDTTFTFKNETAGGDIWQYKWEFGDGDTANIWGPNVPHSYKDRQAGKDYVSGTYNVLLIAGNGACSDTDSVVVAIVPPMPIVSFEGNDGCEIHTVEFENNSHSMPSIIYGILMMVLLQLKQNPKHAFLSHGRLCG